MTDLHPPHPAGSPFDQTAADYDREFTDSVLGRLFRDRVWSRMDRLFAGCRHILELGCGTGEDALHLARQGYRITALDASRDMVARSGIKLDGAGVSDRVDLHCLDLNRLLSEAASAGSMHPLFREQYYDGVLANFGVLNCVPDLPGLARVLHRCLDAGSPVLLTIMGPCVPWEWIWFLLRGRPAAAFRRFRRKGVTWRGIRVVYPSVSRTRAAFAPHFRVLTLEALGTFLPPSYANAWAAAHPGLIRWLDHLDRRVSGSMTAAHLADHYILEMEHSP